MSEESKAWPDGDLSRITSLREQKSLTDQEAADNANKLIQSWKTDWNFPVGKLSDGYHTFDELYEMRLALTVAWLKNKWQAQRWAHVNAMKEAGKTFPINISVWRSRLHHDGTMFDGGWFIVGCNNQPGLMVSFHYEDKYWDLFDFCNTLERAPEWDGHTNADVLERLKRL